MEVKKSIILLINKRNLFNDVYKFDTLKMSWKGVKCSDMALSKRKHHASCVVGDTIIFHGGLDCFGYPLGEMVAFDLAAGTLHEIQCKSKNLEFVSGHTFTSVVFSKDKKFPYFEIPTGDYCDFGAKTSNADKFKIKISKSISYEGIYSFGGINAKGELNNDLMFFDIDTTEPNWMKIQPKGKHPPQRYMHTMNYCAELDCLVLFGGRSEHLEFNQKQFCFNDLWIYQIHQSQWIEIEFPAIVPDARHCHVSCINGTKILIFGGINSKGLCNPNTFIIELKQE